MVYCKKCSIFFSDEHLKEKSCTDIDTGFTEITKVCPLCGRSHLQQGKRCKRCSESFVGKGSLCSQCVKQLKNELEDFLKNYSVDEQEAMLSW